MFIFRAKHRQVLSPDGHWQEIKASICEVQKGPKVGFCVSGQWQGSLRIQKLYVQIERDYPYIPILFGWDWNPHSYSREGSGFLGFILIYDDLIAELIAISQGNCFTKGSMI